MYNQVLGTSILRIAAAICLKALLNIFCVPARRIKYSIQGWSQPVFGVLRSIGTQYRPLIEIRGSRVRPFIGCSKRWRRNGSG